MNKVVEYYKNSIVSKFIVLLFLLMESLLLQVYLKKLIMQF